MPGITEQDLLEALFTSMPQTAGRPPGAFLFEELYECGKVSGGKLRVGKNKLRLGLRRGVGNGTIELIEIMMPNVLGHSSLKPLYRLKLNSEKTEAVV